MRILRFLLAATAVLVLALPQMALAESYVNKSFFGGTAIEGYDPVAYFTEGKPVKGSKDYTVEWKDAKWRFASAENKALFESAPEKYAPQYGGYCAWAVSQGYTADIDPDAWNIVDGKLYLNFNKEIQQRWEKDQSEFIRLADEQWPGVVE